MDKLKQYLLEHRQEMDVDIPPTDLLPHIQAGAVAPAATAMLIKFLIGAGILAIIGTGAWLMLHKQKGTNMPAPAAPPQKEVIQKDTVPVLKDTVPVQPVRPVIKHKKIHRVPPAPPVIPKHKKSVEPVVHPTYPRKKKNPEPVHQPPKPRPKKKAEVPIT